MTDVLIQHAIENVWCNPNQDTKNIIRPKFIGNKHGDVYKVTVAGEDILLPTDEVFYVYQIGQIELTRLSIVPKWSVLVKNEWQNVAVEMSKESLVIDIYSDRGVHLPKTDTFFCVTTGMCLLFAIKENKRIPIDLQTETPCFQFYKNSYFSSQTKSSSVNISVASKDIRTPTDISEIQSKSIELSKKQGVVFQYVNGLLVNEVTARTVSLGDYVELVWDSSVKRIVSFPISSLRTYLSILDSNIKYLLAYYFTGNEIIEYQDDVEIYLTDPSKPTGRGIYFHRNSEKSFRMVTHRDYGLSVSHLDYINEKLQELWTVGSPSLSEKCITLFIKNSGYSRGLVYEKNRLCDLMKLTEYDRERALLGLDSVVSVWTAPNLENSKYAEIMRSDYSQISRNTVNNAYGYDAISVLVGNTPIKTVTESNVLQAKLPIGLFRNTTVYEYDTYGSLITSSTHQNGYWYTCRDGRTKLIEAFRGIGSKKPSTVFGTDDILIPDNTSYRVYLAHYNKDTGICLKDWKDITGTDYYSVVNGSLKWLDRDFSYILQVRFDNSFLDYEIEILLTNSVLRFPITIKEERSIGLVTNEILEIPFGELDVFLNDRSLIEDVDYSYNFPFITIFNKKFLNKQSVNDSQKIRIRFRGFCDSSLNKNNVADRGYVVHGVLSNNDKYDLREDKVQRIVLDGGVVHKTDLKFSEETNGVSVFNVLNGRPYSVSDVIVPVTEFTSVDTYELRNESIEITNAVSEYLTDKLPQVERQAVSVVENKHYAYSPFVSRIIHALKTKEIEYSILISNLSNDEFVNILAPYEYLLKEDPLRIMSETDLLFTDIHPHESITPKSLTVLEYRFLTRVVKMYCNNRVELSGFITIEK